MRAPLFFAILVTLVTWASAFAAIRLAGRGFPPGALALIRFATASAVLAYASAGYAYGLDAVIARSKIVARVPQLRYVLG